ncbi:hypothetical protein OAC78_01865 [Litorivicinus sp.]|nr:hypothetical protein [Litorivicinus sp.]MDB9862101.1 hypothetical protein [Litorivicinus sp.]MDC1208258.1 hypothetical protein [Litorivicinus sp.]MDC1466115.1 hypothetical protein [Litorivicinus sp.]
MMADDELFRQGQQGPDTADVQDGDAANKGSPLDLIPGAPVDTFNDRFGSIESGKDRFSLIKLQNRSTGGRTSAHLKADIDEVAALTKMSWELKPWRPTTLSRALLTRMSNAEVMLKTVATAVDESSRQVAVLYDELDDPSSDETDDG